MLPLPLEGELTDSEGALRASQQRSQSASSSSSSYSAASFLRLRFLREGFLARHGIEEFYGLDSPGSTVKENLPELQFSLVSSVLIPSNTESKFAASLFKLKKRQASE